jgi:hypothetical protein
LLGVADQHHRRISQTNHEGANMTDKPDAKATDAIVKALEAAANDPSYPANIANFGAFKMSVAAQSEFTAIWTTEFVPMLNAARGDPITFYKYSGGSGQFLPLGDVVSCQSADAFKQNRGNPVPFPNGGVLVFGRGPFAHPVGFDRILDDSGSGNPKDMVYYQMNPPSGYLALGICFTNGDPPDPNNYWCVHRDYVRPVGSRGVWSDTDAHWTSCTGSLHAPSFTQQTPAPDSGTILILPPTYLSDQQSNEGSFALVGQQAMLAVSPFAPPDPPNDTTLASGATTTYGLGPVAIVPYTAVPADSWSGAQQAAYSPFYFIASEPFWKCTQTLSSPAGGNQTVGTTIGVSDTEASSFTQSTSMTIGCSVGVGFGDLSAQVSTSYTQAFQLSTSQSATQSSSTTTQTQVNFPAQPTTLIWSRQTQISVFRTDGSLVSTASYGNNDQRFIPSGPKAASASA